jgi:hypothetical protein
VRGHRPERRAQRRRRWAAQAIQAIAAMGQMITSAIGWSVARKTALDARVVASDLRRGAVPA